MLDLFLLEKVAYEICYEAANRPDWLGIPLPVSPPSPRGCCMSRRRFCRMHDHARDFEALLHGTHGDPFAVLGPHGDRVRVLAPGARTVTLLDADGNRLPPPMRFTAGRFSRRS